MVSVLSSTYSSDRRERFQQVIYTSPEVRLRNTLCGCYFRVRYHLAACLRGHKSKVLSLLHGRGVDDLCGIMYRYADALAQE